MTFSSKDCINGLTAINRMNTILSVGRSVGGIYRLKAQGRTALLFAYLKLNTQLMDNRRAKGEFCPLVRRFSCVLRINREMIKDEKELQIKRR